MRKARALTASLLIAVFTATGCWGHFTLTQKVWQINQSVGNKWLQTLVFWAFCIIPVYEVVGFVDIIGLNLVEFWTGQNPLAMKDGKTVEKVVTVNHQPVRLTFSNGGRDVRIDGAGRIVLLHLDEDRATVRDDRGKVLSDTTRLTDGGVEVRDQAGNVVVRRDGAQIEALAGLLQQGADLFAQQFSVDHGTRVASAR